MRQRVISAVIALIICVPIVLIGGDIFKVAVSLLSIFGMYELFKCSRKKMNYPEIIEIISYVLVFLFTFINGHLAEKIMVLILLLGSLIVFLPKEKYNFESFTYLFSSITFLGLIFSYFIKIRINDIDLFIYLFLITILTDTFAYIMGKAFGKHKLLPSVSPNKTIEGSISGSVIGTIIPSVFYLYMVNPSVSFGLIIILTFALSVLGQIGDLFFSSIKRYYKIKDFSNLMPGHGGLLDRLDSVIFVLMGYMLLINFI